MKRAAFLFALSALILADPMPAAPQAEEELKALRREVESLKAGQIAIQKELLEIKNLMLQRELEARRQAPAPQAQARAQIQNVLLPVEGNPIKGDKNARVALVEFSDYQCPFCARHFRETQPKIEEEYVKTGKLRYVLFDFPIESIHPHAFKAHEAANCSAEQGKYWEMHDRLFGNQRALAVKDLFSHAQSLGLDMPGFQQCLESGRYAKQIRQQLDRGQRAGVTGTPTFFVGVAEGNGSIKILRMIRGAQPYAAFKDAIDGVLAGHK